MYEVIKDKLIKQSLSEEIKHVVLQRLPRPRWTRDCCLEHLRSCEPFYGFGGLLAVQPMLRVPGGGWIKVSMVLIVIVSCPPLGLVELLHGELRHLGEHSLRAQVRCRFLSCICILRCWQLSLFERSLLGGGGHFNIAMAVLPDQALFHQLGQDRGSFGVVHAILLHLYQPLLQLLVLPDRMGG